MADFSGGEMLERKIDADSKGNRGVLKVAEVGETGIKWKFGGDFKCHAFKKGFIMDAAMYWGEGNARLCIKFGNADFGFSKIDGSMNSYEEF